MKEDWTHGGLTMLRMLYGLCRPAVEVAIATKQTREACDLARWALLGRSIPDACDYLNGQGREGGNVLSLAR